MYRERCKVLENKKAAPGHYILRLASAKISKNARPGQFVQVLCADTFEPLLPRPFSFLTASKRDFSVLYQVVGQGTKILSQTSKGDLLWILGPLGNGFTINRRQKTEDRRQKTEDRRQEKQKQFPSTIVLVGGGVGIPPLYYLAEQLIRSKIDKRDIHVFLGARKKELLLCEKGFKKLGVDLRVATDDGSKGKKGFVTGILDEFLKSRQNTVDRIQEKQKQFLSTDYCLRSTKMFTCGPTPMLKAVSSLSLKYNIPCEVSVEVPMACGFGACLGCAIKIRRQNTVDSRQEKQDLSTDYCLPSTDYRFAMACCEGSVFQAKEILWD